MIFMTATYYWMIYDHIYFLFLSGQFLCCSALKYFDMCVTINIFNSEILAICPIFSTIVPTTACVCMSGETCPQAYQYQPRSQSWSGCVCYITWCSHATLWHNIVHLNQFPFQLNIVSYQMFGMSFIYAWGKGSTLKEFRSCVDTCLC